VKLGLRVAMEVDTQDPPWDLLWASETPDMFCQQPHLEYLLARSLQLFNIWARVLQLLCPPMAG
jgi:hypothetical protein